MSEQPPRAFDGGEVRSLCRAIIQSIPELGLDGPSLEAMLVHLEQAAASLDSGDVDETAVMTSVRGMRYLLVEAAYGPVAPFLADSAATLIGDDWGKLFF